MHTHNRMAQNKAAWRPKKQSGMASRVELTDRVGLVERFLLRCAVWLGVGGVGVGGL